MSSQKNNNKEQNMEEYCVNPYTSRLIKKGSKTHRRLVAAKLLGEDPSDNTAENNTLLEADTQSDAKALKAKVNKKGVGKNKIVTTRGKKVLKASRRPTRTETIEKVSDYAISSVIDHKEEILGSRMSDEEMEDYIRGMIAKKLVGSYEKKEQQHYTDSDSD